MMAIEIGKRNYLAYLLLPHPVKMSLLSPASHAKLDRINRMFNERIYSGEAAAAYDAIHRYGAAEQHEYPAQLLVERIWAPGGYGHALELGAGSGYFTVLVARRAQRVVAIEGVPDMERTLRVRVASAGLDNVGTVGASVFDLDRYVPAGSMDAALVIQSLHHFHRRPEVLRAVGRAVRPGGSLFLIEPHHNLRRVARLLREYVRTYHAREFWTDELRWATHDFLTRGEIRSLCRTGGFEDVRISGFWFPYSRRFVPDPVRRFYVERMLSRVPGVRHLAAVLAVEARRGAA